jgi:CheY-like chemotaxis protein
VVLATAAETMNGAAFADAASLAGAKTILLVEDEAFVRTVTAEALESAGYRIVAAANATEALKVYCDEPTPVDLLLTDVVMPGMSGRELAAQFKTICPRGRVLLMSGYAGEIALCELSSQSGNYLGKPFSIDALLKRVREVLDTNSSL